MVADGPPQVCQRLAQVGPGGGFRPVVPQQPGKLFAAMGPPAFDSQVSQQRPHLVRAESGDRFSIQGYLKGAKELD